MSVKMINKAAFLPFVLLVALGLSGCKDEPMSSDLPQPLPLTEESAGHYCQMLLLEHDGPKAQVFLKGMPAPLYFSQVRDGLAYLKSPEQDGVAQVLYVNDMGRATSWTDPGANNWMNARDAYYVSGSSKMGGMGVPEFVPFAARHDAEAFAAQFGGEILTFDEIGVSMLLAPVDLSERGALLDQEEGE